MEPILATAALVVAAGVLLRTAIRGYRAINTVVTFIQEVHEVTTRELTHNGGSSVKDHVDTLRKDFREYTVLFTAHVSDSHGGALPWEPGS